MLVFIVLAFIGVAMLVLGLSGLVGESLENGGKKMPKNGEKKDVGKAFFVGAMLTIIAFGAVAGIIKGYDALGPGYTFHREVHGHMENAYYADEPHLMKQELSSAIKGMRDLNLKEDMYGAFWYWEKTPDRSMKYQYEHLEGIIDRVDAVIVWYEQTYSNGSASTETLGDVFEQKMDNLRGFLQEDGWSDWIAQDTYYVNHYLWIFLSPFWLGLLALPFVVFFVLYLLRGLGSGFEKVYKDGKWIWYKRERYW